MKDEIANYAKLRAIVAIRLKKAGNIAGLAKHLGHKYSEPGFFTSCMGDPLLEGYPDDIKKKICARAHKIYTGIWPGEHGGKNPNGRG